MRAKGCESKYIIRGLQGKLRIGLAKNTVLASLSHAVMLTRPRGVVELTEEQLARIRNLDGTDGTCVCVRRHAYSDALYCLALLSHTLTYLFIDL